MVASVIVTAERRKFTSVLMEPTAQCKIRKSLTSTSMMANDTGEVDTDRDCRLISFSKCMSYSLTCVFYLLCC